MKSEAVQTSEYWLLMQVALRARHDFARLAEQKYGLTWIQLHTLCSLRPGEAVPMNAVSYLLVCDASNVTGIADRLIVQGLVVRQEDPQDRRIKMLSLTPKGETLRQDILNNLVYVAPPGLQQLSASEREQFKKLLMRALAQ